VKFWGNVLKNSCKYAEILQFGGNFRKIFNLAQNLAKVLRKLSRNFAKFSRKFLDFRENFRFRENPKLHFRANPSKESKEQE